MIAQLRLDAIERQIPTGRQLVHPKALETLLDRAPHDVELLLNTGYLEYAFDLSSAGANTRSEKRVWRQSVIEYAQGYLGKNDFQRKPDRLAAVVRACLPAGSGPFTISKLARCWTVSSTHLHSLLASGAFRAEPGQALKITHSPLLNRASVSEWLKTRRVA